VVLIEEKSEEEKEKVTRETPSTRPRIITRSATMTVDGITDLANTGRAPFGIDPRLFIIPPEKNSQTPGTKKPQRKFLPGLLKFFYVGSKT
jgi:hypothetical protein